MILAPLQKLPTNASNFGKVIFATGFELLPKVQKIAQSDHTALYAGAVNVFALAYLSKHSPVPQLSPTSSQFLIGRRL